MAKERYPSEQADRFIVRLPDGMRDRIRAAAEANNRSMNAEIVATLEEKYPEPEVDLDAKELDELSYRISATEDEAERLELVKEANRKMSAHPFWKDWTMGIEIHPEQQGLQRVRIRLDRVSIRAP